MTDVAEGSTRHTGGWTLGDPVADRRFIDVGEVPLERGGTLPGVVVAYETWGTLNGARDNAVLICHALTGDAHVVGPAGPGQPTPGWWDGLIGPGKYVDPADWYVVAANVLGGCQGTTGPSSPAPDGRAWGSRFPFTTVRDQVAVEAHVADTLGIQRWAAVIGGSMGAMRALEWPVMFPDRVARSVVLASTAYATAEQIAWCTPQLAAIESDPFWAGGDYYDTGHAPLVGLGVARSIAHVTYRSEPELSTRFGRSPQGEERPVGGGGRYAVESYLEHHRDKLVRRFDAGSYVSLTKAMNAHDLARGRGSVANALAGTTAQFVVAAVDTDRLYPPYLSREIIDALRTVRPGSVRSRLVESQYGHDGFLIEIAQVGELIAEALRQ